MIMVQMCQNTVIVELDLRIKHKMSLNNDFIAILVFKSVDHYSYYKWSFYGSYKLDLIGKKQLSKCPILHYFI